MLLLVILLLILSPLRHVFTYETQLNLTDRSPTDGITVDITQLGMTHNTTSDLIKAAKDFYIEHFPANHFRTEYLSISNRSMDEIRPTLDYLITVTSLDPDIDLSACAFQDGTIVYCKELEASWCYNRDDVPCDSSNFRSVVHSELVRTHYCAEAVARIRHRVKTLFPRKPFWTLIWEKLWGAPPPFQHDADRWCDIPHSDQISACENMIHADELRQRLRAYGKGWM